MRESEFQRKVVAELKQRCCFVFNSCGGFFQRRGMPDLWVAHKVWNGWLELKVEGGVIEDHQIETMRKICERGVGCYVLTPKWICNYKGSCLLPWGFDSLLVQLSSADSCKLYLPDRKPVEDCKGSVA